jgi:hypothetical protein
MQGGIREGGQKEPEGREELQAGGCDVQQLADLGDIEG